MNQHRFPANMPKPDWTDDRGRVALYRGEALDLLRRIPDGVAGSVATDPPYKLTSKSDCDGRMNPWTDLLNSSAWYASWIGECRRLLGRDGTVWTCLNWRSSPTIQKAAFDLDWRIASMLVWDKGSVGPGSLGLRPQYEMVALWLKGKARIINRSLADIQRFKRAAGRVRVHKAQKPVDLMRFMIDHGSKRNQVVVDPFMGSGTTGVAAVQAGRRFVGVEGHAKAFGHAVDRISQALKQGA